MTPTPPTSPITEAELHALVDGQLTAERQREIEAALVGRPDEASRVDAYRAHKRELRALFDPVLDEALPQRVLRAGALGYLAKRSAPDTLIAAVMAVARGDRYVDAQTAQALALAQIDGDASPDVKLSEREFSVFMQLARGRSVAQIAESLSLAPSTVGTHLYHVKQKLGATNQSELTLVALRWGLIQA